RKLTDRHSSCFSSQMRNRKGLPRSPGLRPIPASQDPSLTMSRMRRQSFRISAAVLVAFCFGQSLSTLQADDEPAEGDQKKSVELLPPPSDWERLVYLPYKNLKQVFEKEGAAVFMPYGQFLKMWAGLRPTNLQAPAKPPVAAVISQASYT